MKQQTLESLANTLHDARCCVNNRNSEEVALGVDETDAKLEGFMSAVEAVAQVCQERNPKFDHAYFMARVVQGPNVRRGRER